MSHTFPAIIRDRIVKHPATTAIQSLGCIILDLGEDLDRLGLDRRLD